MCKESLIQYLLNTFQEQKDIEQFIRFHTVSPLLAEKENAVLLNKKLDDIKVCDPAIGSGAFPIGMLQEIFEAKRFIYPYLKTNKDFKPAEVKKNIIQNSIYGVDLEKGAVDIAQLRFWLSLVVDELNPHPLPNLDYKIMQGNSLLESILKAIDLSKIALFARTKG
jgi:type II restriction/modification system DNA methylase subunit YeeA